MKELSKVELIELCEELFCCLDLLESRIVFSGKVKKIGRKDEVLEVLIGKGKVSVSEISKIVGISCRNVSSQLSYLRKDGYNIATNSKGFKFIEDDE